MSELKPCPFLVRLCSMDGQIIGYTCKGECANCPAEDEKDKEIEKLKAELRNMSIELNNINILTDNILNKADFGSKATKAEMHSRLTSIYVYASHIKRALTRTDGTPDTGKMEG